MEREILNEKFYTPRDLEERHIASQSKQVELRKNGDIKFCRIGKKVFYAESHLREFLNLEANAETAQAKGADV